jgi:hypothetical protein
MKSKNSDDFLPRMVFDIDIAFDFRSDTPPGKDPDSRSPTLRSYHRLLWSKELPGGGLFDLSETTPRAYLYHKSTLGEFILASDTVVPAFEKLRRLADVVAELQADEVSSFVSAIYTIGGMMVFPGNRIDGMMTINGARGFHRQIGDRFDLTVECIRRYYRGEDSPLFATLERYRSFFALFQSFQGYVDFFLLQDLTSPDYSAVRFFAPFESFDTSPPLPATVEAYRNYKRLATEFIEARNQRILEWVAHRKSVAG